MTLAAQAKSHAIIVRWNDAPIGHFLAHYDNQLSFEYTIDIRCRVLLLVPYIQNVTCFNCGAGVTFFRAGIKLLCLDAEINPNAFPGKLA